MPPTKKLKDYTPQRRKGGPPPIYPWDKWLDGGTYRLLRGTDLHHHFPCKLKTMEHMIRKQVQKINQSREAQKLPPLNVSVFTDHVDGIDGPEGDSMTIQIQVVP